MAIYDLRTQKVWLFYIPTLQFWGDSSNHSGFIILIFKMDAYLPHVIVIRNEPKCVCAQSCLSLCNPM